MDTRATQRSPARDVPMVDTPMPAGLPTATADPTTMVAHFIDVGQGDATLLEFSCAAVLIDTGGENTARVSGRDRLSRYLEEFFERRADLARTLHLVVLSHPHKDHTDGVSVLLEAEPAIVVMNVVDNGPPAPRASGGKGQRDLQSYAAEIEGVGYVGLAESDIKTVSGATSDIIDPVNCKRGNTGVDPKISALWGRVDLDTTWANDANNDSVVLRVAFGKAVFLFTGDLESQGLSAMLESYAADLGAFDADVLKVGHHGSHNATTADFVTAVTPRIAVIQSGESSPDDETFSAYAFGHPNAKALKLLLDTDSGVSLDRKSPKLVRVGLKGRSLNGNTPPDFTYWTMKKAIYANGWDGNIAIKATSDGRLSVETEY
ncbi:MBL fold metallo-hydrolase [Pseudoxanthomonas sp. Root630]|uniref:ComEC/Rec2 family competence protein n=1 Tax=Pseudoxanthomonas sp. Root630 TaxID=1736574 RepID=UPI00138F29A3|nr:MBL fold metallo-hydrolase [Pseudoxanthomonas sp. Root630]